MYSGLHEIWFDVETGPLDLRAIQLLASPLSSWLYFQGLPNHANVYLSFFIFYLPRRLCTLLPWSPPLPCSPIIPAVGGAASCSLWWSMFSGPSVVPISLEVLILAAARPSNSLLGQVVRRRNKTKLSWVLNWNLEIKDNLATVFKEELIVLAEQNIV